ncbi:uncharacterized protein AB675_1878 [Cyphellophora attinorum]|uniref:Uncharacterized protein n=1 Tax=Cyphellophora attinorum TaxID=1664694 RepID=A0A0N1HCV4_9EURO|nr:uncharacterized protein AB675_1878 [Phialophora attinorum]KPI42647.1 hypothetical protein AB675_1878 [Phialophora attinorum]
MAAIDNTTPTTADGAEAPSTTINNLAPILSSVAVVITSLLIIITIYCILRRKRRDPSGFHIPIELGHRGIPRHDTFELRSSAEIRDTEREREIVARDTMRSASRGSRSRLDEMILEELEAEDAAAGGRAARAGG